MSNLSNIIDVFSFRHALILRKANDKMYNIKFDMWLLINYRVVNFISDNNTTLKR